MHVGLDERIYVNDESQWTYEISFGNHSVFKAHWDLKLSLIEVQERGRDFFTKMLRDSLYAGQR